MTSEGDLLASLANYSGLFVPETRPVPTMEGLFKLNALRLRLRLGAMAGRRGGAL